MSTNSLGATAPKGYRNVKKSDIIEAVAKKTKSTKKAATEIVNAYWDVIKTTLKNDKKASVSIPNVGTIRCITTKARTYSTTGLKNTSKKTVKKGAKTTPKFYVSDNFLTKSATKSTSAAGKKKTGQKKKTSKTVSKVKTATKTKKSSGTTRKKSPKKTAKKK